MRQQINLYQPIFSDGRAPLSASLLGFGLVLVVAALGGYSIYTRVALSKTEAIVEELRARQVEQTGLLTATSDALGAAEKPEVVQARVQGLQRSLVERSAALGVLQSGAAGQATGFAARMEALARRHVDGLWIDKLMLSGTNGSMALGGATLDADIVPVYLHSLAREAVLSGTRFDEFVIERPEKKNLEAEATDADGNVVKSAKPAAVPAHIRFRAGSKALATPEAADTEAAT